MKKIQQGFSIITAIFLLVVLAGLGAAMVTLSTVQNQSSAMDVVGSRAYQAARAGIEWAAYQIVNNPTPATAATCANTFALGSLGGTLSPFTVTVTCIQTPINGDTISWTYDVTAIACTAATCPSTPGASGYIERSISTKFGK
jgi:MSHA biogenesis protein MshP